MARRSLLMKTLLVSAAVCLGLMATTAATQQPSAGLNVGDKAPAFSLPGTDGKTHNLSDYLGKTVVLAWFPKAFTGG
jgi:peroxiredoxin Q/BCP